MPDEAPTILTPDLMCTISSMDAHNYGRCGDIANLGGKNKIGIEA
jgi:hypothetical protein